MDRINIVLLTSYLKIIIKFKYLFIRLFTYMLTIAEWPQHQLLFINVLDEQPSGWLLLLLLFTFIETRAWGGVVVKALRY